MLQPPHTVTLTQLAGFNREHKLDNAAILADSWGCDAILKMFDGNVEEIRYCARVAAHFGNLALKGRSL